MRGSRSTHPYYNTPIGYADFAIPWSLNLNLSYSVSERLNSRNPSDGSVIVRDPVQRATVNAGFDFSLTPNWKVQGRTGYDIVNGEMVLTNFAILRDLDCWQMSFNWVPFGPYQSYSFDLHVKSGVLRDILRLRQPRQDVRDRFGGLVRQ